MFARVGLLAGTTIALLSAAFLFSGPAGAMSDLSDTAPAPLKYTALGDSITYGLGGGTNPYVVQYKSDLNSDLHASTTLTNLAINGWTSGRVYDAVQVNSTYRSSIAGADVITLMVGTNDFFFARGLYLNNTCGGPDNLDCFDGVLTSFQHNLDGILAEIVSLNTKPDTIVRLADLYFPAIGDPATDPTNAMLLQFLKSMNQVIRDVAAGYGYPVAAVFTAFNGEDGFDDPLAKGYIQLPDIVHPAPPGHTAIAGEFRRLGYAPLDVDGDGAIDRVDNCLNLPNPDQANFNAELIRLPHNVVPFNDATNPVGDNVGDACDDDIDIDGLNNVVEGELGTNPVNPDTDGDRVLDGAEVRCGSDPLDAASTPARPNGVTLADADGDQLPDACEAAFGTRPDNPDSDGDRLTDGIEALFFGTDPAGQDSDADGCRDDLEMASVNDLRTVRMGDVLSVLRGYGTRLGDGRYIPSFDMNADGMGRMSDTAFVISYYGRGCP